MNVGRKPIEKELKRIEELLKKEQERDTLLDQVKQDLAELPKNEWIVFEYIIDNPYIKMGLDFMAGGVKGKFRSVQDGKLVYIQRIK